jgi:DNA (cytosine-5)-methyltransferase 1
VTAYYNENDKYAAQWLRNLIEDGLIPWGYVDDRSICDVQPGDLHGYTQCHFFAGLGGWSRALRLAGWPDDRFVWTGSPPCQPFSVAGKSQGTSDSRHLWPSLSALIRECRPPIFFGEQVARAIGMGWFDAVAADLEKENYAVASAVLPACSVGAPHRRDRLWFVGYSNESLLRQEREQRGGELCGAGGDQEEGARGAGNVAHSDSGGQPVLRFSEHDCLESPPGHLPDRCGARRWGEGTDVADPSDPDRRSGEWEEKAGARQNGEWRRGSFVGSEGEHAPDTRGEGLSVTESETLLREGWGQEGGAVAQCDWWAVEPDVGRVAHGVPSRVGKLRALGNAIVPQVAEVFIRSVM